MHLHVDELAALALCSGLVLGAPTLLYARSLAGARLAWPAVTVEAPVARAEAGPYRGAAAPLTAPREVPGTGGAPATVRAAAFACFFLGQWLVPGLPLALLGLGLQLRIGASRASPDALLILALNVLAVPGLRLAWKNLALGGALLHRWPGAAESAEATARFTYRLNGAFGAVGVALAQTERDAGRLPVFGGSVIASALVSVAHAVLLRRAAATLRAVSALEP